MANAETHKTPQDQKADIAINTMMGSMAVMAATAPAFVNVPFVMGAMASGTVAIGLCYGVKLTRQEAWRLVYQFIMGAGITFIGLNIGTKIFAAILQSTGIGYAPAVGLEVTMATALAWAVGNTAKAYFKGEKDKAELSRILRRQFKLKKAAA